LALSEGCGDVAYLINLLALDPGDEPIRKALFGNLGRTVVLLSENATTHDLHEYFIAHRQRINSVVLLGARRSTGPFNAYFHGAFQRRPRLATAIEASAFRGLPLELPEQAFAVGDPAVEDGTHQPDHVLTQALAATPTGERGLAVLCAKHAQSLVMREHSEKQGALSNLNEALTDAEAQRDAAKNAHTVAEGEVTRLEKRRRELSDGAPPTEDEDAAEEGSHSSRRKRPRNN
jgi:hypothetical protein